IREQHATVDDEQLALVLEDGHVATDFGQARDRGDAQRPWLQGRRGDQCCAVQSHRVVPATFGNAPPAAALRSGRKSLRSRPGISRTRAMSSSIRAASASSGPTRGRRTRGLPIRPRPCRMYFEDTVPGMWLITARTSGSSALCMLVAVARSPWFTASTRMRYGCGATFAVTPIKPTAPIAM